MPYIYGPPPRRRHRWWNLDRTDWNWIVLAVLTGAVIGLGAVWAIEKFVH